MSKVSLTSVYADRVKPSQSKPNLDIVTTELPADIAKDAKFKTGFIAVPHFDVHIKEGQKFGSVDLTSENKNIQYTDKNGQRQTAEVSSADLVAAHKEANAAYRKQRTAEVAKDAPEQAVEAEAEVGA